MSREGGGCPALAAHPRGDFASLAKGNGGQPGYSL